MEKMDFSREGQDNFYKAVSDLKRNIGLIKVSEEEKRKYYDAVNETVKKFEERKRYCLNQQIIDAKENFGITGGMNGMEKILEEQRGKLLN